MELIKGLNRDSNKGKMPTGSWVNARNIVLSEEFRDVTNEKGFTKFEDIPGVIVGVISTNTKIVVFSVDSSTGEIGVIDESLNYSCVVKSSALNFNIDNPIEGVFTYNYKQELIVAWWDGLADNANPPRILNIDCLPFEVDINCFPIDVNKLELLLMFPNIGAAEFELISVNNTGGTLNTGVYTFMYAYVLDDGTVTNYSGITNWIPIIKDFYTDKFTEIEGDRSDVDTTKSITLKLNNLNTNYSSIKIAVIKRIGGVTTAITLGDVGFNGTSYEFTYTGLKLEEDISVTELITPTSSFTRVKTGTILDSRLHLANLKEQALLDFQPYANNIKVKWIRTDDINLAQFENSYKDPLIIFNKKGYASDSVYAPVIIFKLKDGTFSRAFHIPNTAPRSLASVGYPGFNSNDLISDINAAFPQDFFEEALLVNSNIRYHEFFNDALSTGETGYWENQTEVYPDEDCSDIKNDTGAVIGTLRNEKVRHHKFPSLVQLDGWGNPFYTPSSGPSVISIFDGSSSITGFNLGTQTFLDFNGPTTVDPAYFVIEQQIDVLRIRILQPALVTVRYRAEVFNVEINTEWRLVHIKASGEQIILGEIIATNDLFNPGNITIDFSETVFMETGDKIAWFGGITGSPVLALPTVFGINIDARIDNTGESDGTTKVMGFQLSDVYIPDEIKEVVDCYYVGYCKKTVENTHKIGQTRLLNSSDKVMDFYNFDIKNFNPAYSFDFLKFEYFYTPPQNDGNLLFVTTPPLVPYINNVRAIKESSYFPKGIVSNLSAQLIDTRSSKSDVLAFEVYNYFMNGVPGTQPTVMTTGAIYQYKKDLYAPFQNQEIIITNKVQNILSDTSEVIYSGDTTINIVGWYTDNTTRLPVYTIINNPVNIDVQESNSIVGYRYSDTTNPEILDIYPPKFLQRKVIFNEETGDEPLPTLEVYLYNFDYNSSNSLIAILPAVCYGDCNPLEPVSTFPYRIARSPKQIDESNILNWRKFFSNSYYEMKDRDKGEVWKLQNYNRSLLIYQKFAMYIAKPKDILKTGDIDAALGVGDIFDRQPDELIPDGKGYVGNQSQWATFTCKYGVIHIDAQQGKIFLFNKGIKEISKQGMWNYFESIKDEVEQPDNPFKNSGWTATFDEEYNRLIVTKLGATSVTVSYDFDNNVWASFHDYYPNYLFYTRNKLFSILNDLTLTNPAGVFQHNIDDKYGIYHDGVTIYESLIEPVFNFKSRQVNSYTAPVTISKSSESINWQTIVKDDSTSAVFYDETFTHILVYNNNQCSGLITLINGKNLFLESDNARNVEYSWKFNKFRDIVIDRNQPIILEDGTINVANLNNNAVWFTKSKFISKFIVIRLIYDNINQRMIHIQDIGVLANKSIR
jgi:hypothetical protein